MSKFQVILLILLAAILAVAIIVASVVVLDYRQRRQEKQWLQEKLDGTSTELEEAAARAKRSAASTQLRALKAPLEMYRLDVGKYPASLDALHKRPPNTPEWEGPYLTREVPLDPWGNPYQYRVSGDRVELSSFGPDGINGTADDVRLEDASDGST